MLSRENVYRQGILLLTNTNTNTGCAYALGGVERQREETKREIGGGRIGDILMKKPSFERHRKLVQMKDGRKKKEELCAHTILKNK